MVILESSRHNPNISLLNSPHKPLLMSEIGSEQHKLQSTMSVLNTKSDLGKFFPIKANHSNSFFEQQKWPKKLKLHKDRKI